MKHLTNEELEQKLVDCEIGLDKKGGYPKVFGLETWLYHDLIDTYHELCIEYRRRYK